MDNQENFNDKPQKKERLFTVYMPDGWPIEYMGAEYEYLEFRVPTGKDIDSLPNISGMKRTALLCAKLVHDAKIPPSVFENLYIDQLAAINTAFSDVTGGSVGMGEYR